MTDPSLLLAHERLDEAGVERYGSTPGLLSLEQRIDLLTSRLRRRTDALRTIRDEQGKVCSQYEVCTHVGCLSSYTAWVVADIALEDDRGEL